jgi:hypothetical protein
MGQGSVDSCNSFVAAEDLFLSKTPDAPSLQADFFFHVRVDVDVKVTAVKVYLERDANHEGIEAEGNESYAGIYGLISNTGV